MTKPFLYPTGTCFDDCVEILCTLSVDELRRAEIVHGICLGDEAPYAHGWIELDGEVWQAGIFEGERVYYRVPVETFLAACRVQCSTRYTVQQASDEERRTGKLGGPWVPEYEALCGGGRRIMGSIHYTAEN